ncbi:unnamed protein product [Cylindrotheca closterium]|uniref:Glutathione transferase n=1 Tax=Cylindrotheca closterium TaxID=2856 RepID=A0AAD2G8W7_9STRA|nr:unnamed protein product [Cylindrotheca closterium]
MKISPSSKLVLNYLEIPNGIGGRGGALRFFLLSQGIPFEEKLFALGEEWETEKKRLKESGENPTAKTPVVFVDGQTPLPEHIATARLLAQVHGCASTDVYKNYIQDLVADEYQGFRDTWVDQVFTATDEEKAAYKSEGLPNRLAQFDALYSKFMTDDFYLGVSEKTKQPLWGDAACFGLVRDHIVTGIMVRDDLKKYPKLEAMFSAYEKIPAVAQWIASKN